MNFSNFTTAGNTAPDFSIDTMLKAMDALERLSKPLVGIACSPAFKAKIPELEKPLPILAGVSWGVPFLIDSRMRADFAEAFYDEASWRARCLEQKTFDESLD